MIDSEGYAYCDHCSYHWWHDSENDSEICVLCGRTWNKPALPLDRDGLITELREAHAQKNPIGHRLADMALLRFINDPEITKLFLEIGRWYS